MEEDSSHSQGESPKGGRSTPIIEPSLSSLPFKFGDDVLTVQRALGIDPNGEKVRPNASVRFVGDHRNGIIAGFDANGTIQNIRLFAPFSGSIAGIRVGGTIDDARAILGQPLCRHYSPTSQAFELDSMTDLRIDLEANRKIKTVFLQRRFGERLFKPRFMLVVPAHWNMELRVSGPPEAMPAVVQISPKGPKCHRARLPTGLDRLTFTADPRETRKKVPVIFHMEDYLIACEKIVDVLTAQLPSDLEIAKIDMRSEQGALPAGSYFAVKVLKRIDCIDPHLSFQKQGSGGNQETVSFADSMIKCTLDESVAAEFANDGPNGYLSYPDVAYPSLASIENVHLFEDRIPDGIDLFEAAYWPGSLFMTPKLIQQISKIDGSAFCGYLLWQLDPAHVARDYFDLTRDLR